MKYTIPSHTYRPKVLLGTLRKTTSGSDLDTEKMSWIWASNSEKQNLTCNVALKELWSMNSSQRK
jgi:hypothetical protein